MENQSQSEVVLQHPQTLVEQPKQSNFLVILLSVLLFFSISIAGFFAYQTQTLVKELSVLKNEETDEMSDLKLDTTPTTNPTENWKTYTGKIFTFKYPEGMTIDQKLNISDPNNSDNIGDLVILC